MSPAFPYFVLLSGGWSSVNWPVCVDHSQETCRCRGSGEYEFLLRILHHSALTGIEQRGFLADHTKVLAAAPGHITLINSQQQQDPEDPWLHLEWAAVLKTLQRAVEAAKHYQVHSEHVTE